MTDRSIKVISVQKVAIKDRHQSINEGDSESHFHSDNREYENGKIVKFQ